jgi:hypothetical protein
MFPERRAVLKFFSQESKCEVFYGTFKLHSNILNSWIETVSQEVSVVSECKILRTILQKIRFLNP